MPKLLTLLLLAGPVSGKDYLDRQPRLYVSAGGALVLAADVHASAHDSFTGQRVGADVAFGAGPGLVLVMGHGQKAGVRGELECAYRTFAIDKSSNLRLDDRVVPGPLEAGGDVTSFSVMNDIVSSLPLRPVNLYVGGGIGIARVEAEWRSLAGTSFPEADDRKDVLAWRSFNGFQYHPLEDLSAALGYRYFATDDSRLRRANVPAGSHNLELSITHWLN